MRKLYAFLCLLTALAVAMPTRAQEELTVADGTVTNSFVPVYGFYTDAYLHSQMIFPASMLDEMAGNIISSLTWYLDSPASTAWGVNVVFSLGEVDDTSFSVESFVTEGLTEVWSGNMDGTTNEVNLLFEQGYTYDGGNLLIDVYTTNEGSYSSCQWAGITQDGGSISGYSYSDMGSITPSIRYFLPKTTFSYEFSSADACRRVKSLTVTEIDSNTATITWIDTANLSASYDIELISGTDTQVVATAISGTTYTYTGINANTVYTFGVRAVCAADNASSWATIH